jgi:hypothetical protein
MLIYWLLKQVSHMVPTGLWTVNDVVKSSDYSAITQIDKITSE